MPGFASVGGTKSKIVDIKNPEIYYDTESDPYTIYNVKSKLPDVYSKLSVENFSILSIDYETLGGVSIRINIASYDAKNGRLRVNRSYRGSNQTRMYFNNITFRVVY